MLEKCREFSPVRMPVQEPVEASSQPFALRVPPAGSSSTEPDGSPPARMIPRTPSPARRRRVIFVARNRLPSLPTPSESIAMKKRSSLAPFLLLAVLFAGVWMYFTPWLALRKIQAAAERGDAQALNEMV